MPKKKLATIPVLVTTAHRGVFFGYTDDPSADVVILKRARNCVYWDVGTRGFMGLASRGPTGACRVGPSVEEIRLYAITSVVKVSDAAVAAWEAAPWK